MALSDVDKKDFHVESVTEEASKDKEVLSEVLEGILSKKEVIRYNSFKVLLLLSEEHPEVLYPQWDFFAGFIDSDNVNSKYIAVYIIANLTRVDTEKKFEKIFEKYYNLLDDRSVIPAAHLAGNSGKIARAKPELQPEITRKLLRIDETHHELHHKDLIKGYVIEAFNDYFEDITNKEEILQFAKNQLKSKSLRTRKKAEKFLKTWASER